MQRRDGELPSADRTRHHHVGEQEIDAFVRVDDVERFAGVAGGERPVTEALDLADDVSGTRTSSSTTRMASSPPSIPAMLEASADACIGGGAFGR